MNQSINQSSVQGNFSSYPQFHFVVRETGVSVVTALLLYLITAFVVYEIKKPGLRYLFNLQKMQFQLIPKHLVAMRVEIMFSLLFLLGRFICEHIELLFRHFQIDIDYCDSLIKTKLILTFLGVTAVYLFFWTRQRFCYSEPAMQHLSTKSTKIISWTSVLILLLAEVLGSILFLVTRKYTKSHGMCIVKQTTRIPLSLAWIWMTITSLCFRLLLAYLFIYPLVKHKHLTAFKSGFNDFLPLIKRTTIVTVICIVTDVINGMLNLFIRNQVISTVFYDTSLLTNVVCILFSFGDWKQQISICHSCNIT